MSILRRFFGRRPLHGERAGIKQVCIVDASGFIDKKYREHNGQTSPRDNFFILKNLAHFAQREDIEMIAVFVGRPLREAGEGDSFKGVIVSYAPDEKSLPQKIREAVKSVSSRKESMVVTDDRHIEKEAAKLSAQCMRISTFRKGMEGNGEHERQFTRTPATFGAALPARRISPAATSPAGSGPAAADGRKHAQTRPAPAEPEHTPAETTVPPGEEKPNKNVLDLIDPI